MFVECMYDDLKRKAIYKWRENHVEEWRKYHNQVENERYQKNKVQILARKKENYDYVCYLFNKSIKKEFQLLCNISNF